MKNEGKIKMKKLIPICLLLAIVTSISAQQTDFPSRPEYSGSGLTGPYLGQKPPGIPSNTQQSRSKALQCLTMYIEAMNSQKEKDLMSFFTACYGNSDHTRRLEFENSLKKSWGQLSVASIAYDSEKEAILLIRASKMPDSWLVFDLKLSETGLIELFTRTGVNQKPGGQAVSIREIITVADRAVPVNDSIIEHSTLETARAYNDHYFIPEAGHRISQMLTDNLRNGKYNKIRKAGQLADSLKRDILNLHFDTHSWIEADRELVPEETDSPSSQNFGFEKVGVLDGNTGYIKLNEFSPKKEAMEMAGHVLDSLSGCRALILDLRDNVGGYPEMLRFFAGYFFSVPTKINTLYDRNGKVVEEIWTTENSTCKKFDDDFPLVILTSKRTASAAEGFVNIFKNQKRATIVGETTAGARHPAMEVRIGTLFTVSIPFLRGEEETAEGQGIVPDIQVQEEEALDKAVELIRKTNNKKEY